MNLPFTQTQFFEVFARYNEDVMPLQLALILLALSAFGALMVRRRESDRVVSAILCALWLWIGIVYHLMYFREINPAATLFAVLSIAGAALFAWAGLVRSTLVFDGESRVRRIAGHVMIAYALVAYPVLSAMLGREFPQMPTFGLPCPTTIFTIGMLAFVAAPVPRYVFFVPVAWTMIGATAALQLGVYEDLGLVVAGLAGIWLAFDPPPRMAKGAT